MRILFLTANQRPKNLTVPLPARQGRALLLLKSALAAGERWITVTPPGHDKGQPILIKEQPDGSAKVVGGIGGALNHLRLTSVRPGGDYKGELRKRAEAAKERKKRQRDRDRKDGLTASKTQAREHIKAQVGQEAAKFVQEVARAQGWTPDEMRFPEEQYQNASEGARKAAAEKHARELVRRAMAVTDATQQHLVQDAEARGAAGLGEVKLTSSSPDEISTEDLAPIPSAAQGLGFAPAYGERAKAAGLTSEALAAEAQDAKGEPKPGAAVRRATAEGIAQELKAIRAPVPALPATAVTDAKKAMAVLKARKTFDQARKAAAAQRKKVDEAREPVEPKAFVLEGGAPVQEDDITAAIEKDLRTARTRAFLDEAASVAGGVKALERHIGVGAYNSINALSLAAGGTAMLDRSVVDVLGIAGAAQVLARRLGTDLTPGEMEQVRDAMQSFHLDHYMQASDEALREARSWQEMAHEVEVGEASTGGDLAAMQELNAKRRDFTVAAQRALGTAFGEMEANAALVTALRQPNRDAIDVSLGSATPERGIEQARAIGLDRGDYSIEKVGQNLVLTVTGAGMDKLAQPVSRADLARVRESLDIIEGRQDEDGWLPAGVARRPDLAMTVKPGTAPRLAQPFRPGGDMAQAIRDYIGGRAADGDPPADIMQGLLSEDTLQRAGDRGAFMAALDQIAPLYGPDGKMIRAEAYQGAFEAMADAFTERVHGGTLAPIHKQHFPVDDKAVEALHRALAEHPDGVAAFKPVGELTPQDQGALRAVFAKEYGRSDPKTEAMRSDLEKLDGQEPAREAMDMFGTQAVNPEWTRWKAERDGKAAALNKASMTWGKYIDVLGNPANAYAAMQDVVRGQVLDAFAKHHNTLRPEAPLKTGRSPIAHDLNHLDALDPEARERRIAEQRELADRLRNRVAGRYAAGSVSEKMDAARAAEEAASQAQMGLFGTPEPAAASDEPEAPVRLGERRTIGHQAERQVAGMMPIVGKQFKAGQPIKLWAPAMSGKFVGRQRAVKLIAKNRRVALAAGTGSGKSSIMLSSFAHLKSNGQAKRGLFVVPSIVQGQMHGEALNVLQPGRYNWHANSGASREERIAAYKDPKSDFQVVTHSAFRDDMLHLAAKRENISTDAVADKLDAMTWQERRDYMRGLMQAEGMDHDYLAVDEGHALLNRAGKENSRMANVLDGVGHGMGTYVSATADPIKNDPSEAFDVLHKMDPERYSDRDAFMRRYGVDTVAARDGLRREMVRNFYTGRIDPDVTAHKSEMRVDLDQGQHAKIAALGKAAAAARLARMKGEADVSALRALSPGSFDRVPEAQHAAVAKELNRNIGILHSMAVHHAIGGGAKIDAIAKVAGERKGKPGVVFAHNLSHVQAIAERLKRDGHRVVTLTGADSSRDKNTKLRAFQGGEHDIAVMSDAGATGANMQRGKWVAQADVPDTAMLHHQRGARVHRMGQTGDVDLIDVVANHPAETKARKRLLRKYSLCDVMTSPLDGLDDTGVAGYLNRERSKRADAEQPGIR